MALEDFFTELIDVERPSGSSGKDQAGAPVYTYTRVYADVPCQVTETSGGSRQLASLFAMGISHEILTFQTDIRPGDRIKLLDTGKYVKVEASPVSRAVGSIPTYCMVYGSEIRS